MFLRNCWYVAGWSHHFPKQVLVGRQLLGEPIVLYRQRNGRVAALEDRCCHRLAPLSRGRLEGDDLRCMYHGLKFSPSGKCVEIPQQEIIPSTAMVRSYPVVEQDRWVWLWMGDPALADPTAIPRALGHHDPLWHMQTGELSYAASYELINDNLLDLSHLSYVHQNALGRNTMSWGESRPTTTRIERGLRIQRWVLSQPAPGYLNLPAGTFTDMWASYDYLVPGLFLLAASSYPPGTAKASGMQAPSAAPMWRSLTSQAVTPIADRQTIYFYSGCLEEDARDRGKLATADRLLRKGVRRG